jgi:hypothetical protein
MVKRFAAGGLIEMENAAEDGIGSVGDGAGGETLVVKEDAEEEDFVERGRLGLWLGGFFGGRAAKGKEFLGIWNAELLADLEEVALEAVELLDLGNSEFEAARNMDEDITFLNDVEAFGGLCGDPGGGGFGGGDEDWDFLRGEAPGLGGGRGNHPPFPIHGALQAGFGAGLVGLEEGGEEEEQAEDGERKESRVEGFKEGGRPAHRIGTRWAGRPPSLSGGGLFWKAGGHFLGS